MRRAAKLSETPDVITPAATALEPLNGGHAGIPALPTELQAFTGFEGLDSSLFIIPRVGIMQHMTKIVGATPGKFRINLTGEEFDSLHMLVIKADMGRIWRDKNLENKKPLCRSLDGWVPDPSIEEPPSNKCRIKGVVNGKPALVPICPKAHWGEKKERPDCDETYNLLALSVDDLLPFWFTVHGMALRPTMGYLSSIALRRAPLWKFHTRVTLKEIVDAKGKYFIPNYERPQPVTPDMETQIIGMVASLMQETVQRTFEAEEAAMNGDADLSGVPAANEPEEPVWMKEGK